MSRMMRGTAVILAAVLGLSACGGGKGEDPLKKSAGGGGSSGSVVIGSANFPESQALAQVYAQALEAKGIKATIKKSTNREAYYQALTSGDIQIFPEYNGNLLLYLDKTATAVTSADVDAALKQKLPASLTILNSAQAEDKDAVVVTRATAGKYKLKTIEDLKPVAGTFVFGGPSEFKTRQSGLVGIKQKYGIEFKQFTSLDTAGPITVAKLKQGEIQAANLFTTDAAVTKNDFVALEDPKNVFPAQNVTPLVSTSRVDDTARQVLNAISAKLTTQDLLVMNTKMTVDKADPQDVAKDWLKAAGLV